MTQKPQTPLSAHSTSHQARTGTRQYQARLETDAPWQDDDDPEDEEIATPGARALIAGAILRSRGLE